MSYVGHRTQCESRIRDPSSSSSFVMLALWKDSHKPFYGQMQTAHNLQLDVRSYNRDHRSIDRVNVDILVSKRDFDMITLIKRVSGGSHVRKYISRILDHRDLSTNIDKYFTERYYICNPMGCFTTKLTEEERKKFLTPLLSYGWQVHPDKDAIYKEFIFKDFSEAFVFITKVAMQIEGTDHHPQIVSIYNRVIITVISLDGRTKGLSKKEVKLATLINVAANPRLAQE